MASTTSAIAVCRQCRREGGKLFLKGERCYSRKCAFERRAIRQDSTEQSTRTKVKAYWHAAFVKSRRCAEFMACESDNSASICRKLCAEKA